MDGINGDVVILAPPYNVTEAELTEIVDKTATIDPPGAEGGRAGVGSTSALTDTPRFEFLNDVTSIRCYLLLIDIVSTNSPAPPPSPSVPGRRWRKASEWTTVMPAVIVTAAYMGGSSE